MGLGAPSPSSPDPWLPLLSNWFEYLISAIAAGLLIVARALNNRHNSLAERVDGVEKKVAALETIGLVEKVDGLHNEVSSLKANYQQVDHDLKGVRQNQITLSGEQQRLHKENQAAGESLGARFDHGISEIRRSFDGALSEVRRDVSEILKILVNRRD